MTAKTYLWKGPATAVEVWPSDGVTQKNDQGEIVAVAPLLSEMATPGQAFSVALDLAHPVVRSWLAFGLVAEQTALAPAPQNDPDPDAGADPRADAIHSDAAGAAEGVS